jgi:hypothetical protein
MDLIASNFDPHPQPLSQNGRGEQESCPPSPALGEGVRRCPELVEGDEGVQSRIASKNSGGYLIHDPK